MITFEDIKEVRKLVDSSILKMPGVRAIATGLKKTEGELTKELAIIIYVSKKMSLDRLPLHHTIPSSITIGGIKVSTDIVEVGYYVPYSYTGRERPAIGGASIGHVDISAGTLGGLVCGPTCDEEEALLILSNNHVLANSNKAKVGDHIVQPGPLDGGTCHNDCIATLERFVPINFSKNAVNYVDCAVAKPVDNKEVSFEIHDTGELDCTALYTLTPDDVTNETQVQKAGRTTEHSVGYVSALDWKGTIFYEWNIAYFEKQIVIESLDSETICQGGDSGSLALTMDRKACGLLFAGPTEGQHYIANPIWEVVNSLGVGLYKP